MKNRLKSLQCADRIYINHQKDWNIRMVYQVMYFETWGCYCKEKLRDPITGERITTQAELALWRKPRGRQAKKGN